MSPWEGPLRIEPGFSRRLALYVVLSHGLGMSTLVALPLAMPWRLVLSLLVVISLVHGLRSQVLRSGRFALRAAELGADGSWLLYTAKGAIQSASLSRSSFVRPRLTVLNFSTGRFGRSSMILLPDAVDGETLRRLRVRLRTLPRSG